MSDAHNTGDSFRDLAQGTLDFYARFDYTPTVENMTMNFQEEARELVEAAREDDLDHTAEEAADVMVTAIGLCFAAGVDVERLMKQIYMVIAKNDAKNHETHVLYEGKIRRRSSIKSS